MNRPLLVGGCFLLTACGGYAPSSQSTTSRLTTTTSAGTSTQSTPTATEPAPWFGVGGSFDVVDGAIAGRVLEVSAWTSEELTEPECVEERAVESAVTVESTEPEVLLLAWVRTAPSGACPTVRGVPADLYLGLGLMHPELVPHVRARGLDEATVYGAYAAFPPAATRGSTGTATSATATDSGLSTGTGTTEPPPVPATLYVFGVAGTEANLDGTDPAVDEPPLPDGSYRLDPIFLFSGDDVE